MIKRTIKIRHTLRLILFAACGLAAISIVVATNDQTTATPTNPASAASTSTGQANGANTMSTEAIPGKFRQLTPQEAAVIVNKGTERPFTGEYDHFTAAGVYTCRRCGAMLYRSGDKFDSGCGWPAFDDEIPGAVKHTLDADKKRTEITCNNCDAHLGHVFVGERLTEKNTRHCVNSISLLFIPEDKVKYGRAIFAGGCFWGIEHWFQQQPGVIDTTVGYIGGAAPDPTYETIHARPEATTQDPGHAEAVEILYDPVRVSFEQLAKVFFEIHDPTQLKRQGPDIGAPYRSAIFTVDEDQQATAMKLINELQARKIKVVTEVTPAGDFWPAEDYHQNFYQAKGAAPACHVRKKLW